MTPDHYLDALLSLPALYGAEVSPDGRWVAWTWANAGPASDVYAAPTDGSAAPIRMTATPQDSVLVSWTPDSSALIVGEDHDGDEHTQLFRVDLAHPGGAQPLTEPAPPYFLYGGQLHPDSRWLFYSMNYDVAQHATIEQNWVYRHDLQSGERSPLARPVRAGYSQPSLNRQGTHLLYTRKDLHPAGEQVWLVDVEGRDDHEILNAGADRQVAASWLPDGRRALVVAETGTYRRVGLWSLDDERCRWLIDDPHRAVESAYAPYGSELAVVVEVRDARSYASLLNLETGAETPLPRIPGDLIPLAPAPDGRWVGTYSSSQQPTDLILFAPDAVEPATFVSLTRIWERTPLRREDLAQAQSFHWRSVDGVEIQGWLYRPRAADRGTIIHVHGGPTWHSPDRINAQIQYLVSQGFTVLEPNYRGSTGFGLPFQEAIKEDGWGGREQEDIRAGIEALIAAGIARPGKVGITGTSYGGYSAWCAITRFPPELMAAAAPICGMTDLVTDYQTTRPDLRPYSEEMMGGSPEEVPERYYERSPVHYVDRIKGRLLIVQGLRDPNVTPENVRLVRAALDAAGVPYELLAFEDEGHGISRPKNQRVLYPRLAEFFAEAFA